MTLDQLLAYIPQNMLMPTVIGYIVGSLMAAFFGFRLFKLSLIISASAGGFVLGYSIYTLAFGDSTDTSAVGLVLGLACAVVLGLIAVKLYKALIYIIGGTFGAVLGFMLPYFVLVELGYDSIGIIVGMAFAVICAILGAKLMYKFFKIVVILESSYVGISGALTGLFMLLETGSDMSGVVVLGTIVLGTVAASVQFKHNKGRSLLG